MIARTKPRCEAYTGRRYLDSGQQEPIRCHQQVGLRVLSDYHGEPRYFCAAPGHHGNVARRFGTTADELSLATAKEGRP